MKKKHSATNNHKKDFVLALILVSVCLAVTIITDAAYFMIRSAIEDHNSDYAEGLVTAPASVSPGYIWLAVLVLIIWGGAVFLCFYFKKQYFHLFTAYLFTAASLGYGWYTVTVLADSASASFPALMLQMCCGVFAYIADPIWDALDANFIFVTVFSLIMQIAFAALNFYLYFHNYKKNSLSEVKTKNKKI